MSTFPEFRTMSVQLVVPDLERSIDFYTGLLGFAVEFRYEDFYAGLYRDGHSIHLKSGTPTPEERLNRRENEHLDLLFSVRNIEHTYERWLNDPAAEIIVPLRSMPYGKEFYIADPDGYVLGFLE